ncbi:Uncharacterised protein [Candidatus Burarchaeum australiense]|nr:Uncharacterised protein [Candidatus Burarchaeum australiense]
MVEEGRELPRGQVETFCRHVREDSLPKFQEFLLASRENYGGTRVVRDVAEELAFHSTYMNDKLLLCICVAHPDLKGFDDHLFGQYIHSTLKSAVRMLDEPLSAQVVEFLKRKETLERVEEWVTDYGSSGMKNLTWMLMGAFLSENPAASSGAWEICKAAAEFSPTGLHWMARNLLRASLPRNAQDEGNPELQRAMAAFSELVRGHSHDETSACAIASAVCIDFDVQRLKGDGHVKIAMLYDVLRAYSHHDSGLVRGVVASKLAKYIGDPRPGDESCLLSGCLEMGLSDRPRELIDALLDTVGSARNEYSYFSAIWLLRKISHENPGDVLGCLQVRNWDRDYYDAKNDFGELLKIMAAYLPHEVHTFINGASEEWNGFNFGEVRMAANNALQQLRHPGDSMPVPAPGSRSTATSVNGRRPPANGGKLPG